MALARLDDDLNLDTVGFDTGSQSDDVAKQGRLGIAAQGVAEGQLVPCS